MTLGSLEKLFNLTENCNINNMFNNFRAMIPDFDYILYPVLEKNSLAFFLLSVTVKLRFHFTANPYASLLQLPCITDWQVIISSFVLFIFYILHISALLAPKTKDTLQYHLNLHGSHTA